jgi:hypothetical protein
MLRSLVFAVSCFAFGSAMCHAGPIQFSYQATLGSPGATQTSIGSGVFAFRAISNTDGSPVAETPWIALGDYGVQDPFMVSGSVGPGDYRGSVIGLASLPALRYDAPPTGMTVNDTIEFNYRLTDFESGESADVKLFGQYIVYYDPPVDAANAPTIDRLWLQVDPTYRLWELGRYEYEILLYAGQTSPSYASLWASVSTRVRPGFDPPEPESPVDPLATPEPGTIILTSMSLVVLAMRRWLASVRSKFLRLLA